MVSSTFTQGLNLSAILGYSYLYWYSIQTTSYSSHTFVHFVPITRTAWTITTAPIHPSSNTLFPFNITRSIGSVHWRSDVPPSLPVSLHPKIEADDWELPAPVSPVSASLTDSHDFTGRLHLMLYLTQNGYAPILEPRSLTRDCVWECWDLDTQQHSEYQRWVCQQVSSFIWILRTTHKSKMCVGLFLTTITSCLHLWFWCSPLFQNFMTRVDSDFFEM